MKERKSNTKCFKCRMKGHYSNECDVGSPIWNVPPVVTVDEDEESPRAINNRINSGNNNNNKSINESSKSINEDNDNNNGNNNEEMENSNNNKSSDSINEENDNNNGIKNDEMVNSNSNKSRNSNNENNDNNNSYNGSQIHVLNGEIVSLIVGQKRRQDELSPFSDNGEKNRPFDVSNINDTIDLGKKIGRFD